MLKADRFRFRRPWGDLIAAPAGVGLAFLWGVAEGTFFFIVPDVLISLVALVRPRSGWRHILVAVAGSVLAGSVLFGWSVENPRRARQAIAEVPLVKAEMFTHVDQSFRTHGPAAILLGPLCGIPYKIYAVEAPSFLDKVAFLSLTIPARGERFLFVWAVFGAAGSLLRRRLKRTDSELALGHACVWFLLYSTYACLMHFR